jgi:hypothetical protein
MVLAAVWILVFGLPLMLTGLVVLGYRSFRRRA